MAQPSWITPEGTIGQFQEGRAIDFAFRAISSDGLSEVSNFKLQSGRLPQGQLENPIRITTDGRLVGIPVEVATDVTSQFTVRATDSLGQIRDRTFSMTVVGASPPRFTTIPGTILATTDSTYVYFQIQYNNTDPNNNPLVEIVSGRLPPGLSMTNTGLITGYCEPPLTPLGQPTIKSYTFTVQLATDSGTTLSVYTINVRNYYIDNPVPATNARPPVILNSEPLTLNPAPSDIYYGYYCGIDGYLGRFRHDNEIVFKLAGYDFEGITDLTYTGSFAAVNNSGPGGTATFDSQTGWITGKLPNIGNAVLDFFLTFTVIKNVPAGTPIGITSITMANPGVVTTARVHNLSNGDNISITGVSVRSGTDPYSQASCYAKVLTPTTFEMYSQQSLQSSERINTSGGGAIISPGQVTKLPSTRSSKQYRYTLTLVGTVDNEFTWNSPENLGTLYNGEVSTLAVNATSSIGAQVAYRIVADNTNNLNDVASGPLGTVSPTTINSTVAVGDYGTFAYSTDYAQTWNYVPQFSYDRLQAVTIGNFYDTTPEVANISSVTVSTGMPLSPVRMTTLVAHNLSNGQVVKIDGFSGAAVSYNLNSVLYVRVISATQFDLYYDASLTIPYTNTVTVTGLEFGSFIPRTGVAVAMGSDQASVYKIYRSVDGINWSPGVYDTTVGPTPTKLNKVILVNNPSDFRQNYMLAVGDGGFVIYGSQNGFIWLRGSTSGSIQNPLPTGTLNSVVSTSLTNFVTVGLSTDNVNPVIWYMNGQDPRTDSWIPGTITRTAASLGTVTVNPGGQISAIQITNPGSIYYSPPVVTLTGGSGTITTTVTGVLTNGVLTGFTGLPAGSGYLPTDTITATVPAPTAYPGALKGVAYGLNLWVAVGEGGLILQSEDSGASWTAQNRFTTTEELNDILFANGQFVIVGSDGGTWTSTEGTNGSWSYLSARNNNDLNSVTYGPTKPDSGTLITNITVASTARVTTDTTHQLESGDRIVITRVLGMTQINNRTFYVRTINNQQFDLYVDSDLAVPFSTLGFTAYTSGGNVSILKQTFIAVGQNGVVAYGRQKLIYDPAQETDEWDEFLYSDLDWDQNATLITEWATPTLGQLPPNLVMLPSGDISGRLAFQATDDQAGIQQGTSQEHYFNVQAYIPGNEEVAETRRFYLVTNQRFDEPYDNLYMQCYTNSQTRSIIGSLLSNYNNSTIPSNLVYRVNDPYFGIPQNIIYRHAYGIPSSTVSEYLSATNINHYWRDITLGELKTAVARDDRNNVIYDVVYSEIIDDLNNTSGESISKAIRWPYKIPLSSKFWYDSLLTTYDSFVFAENPVTVTVLANTSATRYQVNTITDLNVGMVLSDNTTQIVNLERIVNSTTKVITYFVTLSVTAGAFPTVSSLTFQTPSFYTALTPGFATTLYPASLTNMRSQIQQSVGYFNDDTVLPRWMTSQQLNGSTLGYTPAWVIAYIKPGTQVATINGVTATYRYSDIVKNNIIQWQATTGIPFNQIRFTVDRFEVDKSLTFDWNTNQWISVLPSAQPSVTNNTKDQYVLFKQYNILPTTPQTG